LLFHKTLWGVYFLTVQQWLWEPEGTSITVGPQTMAFLDQTLEKTMPLFEVVQDDFRLLLNK